MLICTNCDEPLPNHTNLCSCGEILPLEMVEEEALECGIGHYPPHLDPVIYEKVFLYDLVEIVDEEFIMTRKNEYTELYVPPDSKNLPAYQGYENLETLVLPEGLQSIDHYAFQDSKKLRHVEIPSTVTSFGYLAFETSLWLANENPDFLVVGDGICLRFSVPEGEKKVVIPEGVKTLTMGLFAFGSMETVQFPSTLQVIAGRAFTHCKNLREIELPESLETIDFAAFKSCIMLEKVRIPPYLKYLGEDAFEETMYTYNFRTYLKSYEFPLFMTYGETMLFYTSKLAMVTIPDGIVSIASKAFCRNNQVTHVKCPDSLTEMGTKAFGYCRSLQYIKLPKHLKMIQTEAFSHCSSLTHVVLPKGLKRILPQSFLYCSSLQSIHLPEGLEELADYAFAHCSSLKSVVLPSTLKKMGQGVFEGCTNLESVVMQHPMVVLPSFTFADCDNLQELEIPETLCFIEPYAIEMDVVSEIQDSFTETADILQNYAFLQPKWELWEESHHEYPQSPEDWEEFFQDDL